MARLLCDHVASVLHLRITSDTNSPRRPVSSLPMRVAVPLLTIPMMVLANLAPTRAEPPAQSQLESVLARFNVPAPPEYRAFRRLEAGIATSGKYGWLEVWTEHRPGAGFSYHVVREGGYAAYVRNKILRGLLEGEALAAADDTPVVARRHGFGEPELRRQEARHRQALDAAAWRPHPGAWHEGAGIADLSNDDAPVSVGVVRLSHQTRRRWSGKQRLPPIDPSRALPEAVGLVLPADDHTAISGDTVGA